jgi:hypothetical protein
MNQNVRTTDKVQFDSVTCTKINSGSGWTEVPVYITGDFTCTLFVDGSAGATAVATYTMVGNLVTVRIAGNLLASTGTSSVLKIGRFPDEIRPLTLVGTYMYIPVYIRLDSNYEMGTLYTYDGSSTYYLKLERIGAAAWPNSTANCGIMSAVFSYRR